MKCPTCNAEIPDKTDICPHYKSVLKDVDTLKKEAAERMAAIKREGVEAVADIDKRAHSFSRACIILAVVVVVVMAVIAFTTGSPTN